MTVISEADILDCLLGVRPNPTEIANTCLKKATAPSALHNFPIPFEPHALKHTQTTFTVQSTSAASLA